MKLWIKLALAIATIGIGIGVWLWLNRKTVSTSHVWAVSDALQAGQLSMLSTQMAERVTREEVLAMIAQSTGAGNTFVSVATGPDSTLSISSNGQTAFVVNANEPRRKVFLNGVKLEENKFSLMPPSLTYLGSTPLETNDKLTLAY